jgi:hypothetical protein
VPRLCTEKKNARKGFEFVCAPGPTSHFNKKRKKCSCQRVPGVLTECLARRISNLQKGGFYNETSPLTFPRNFSNSTAEVGDFSLIPTAFHFLLTPPDDSGSRRIGLFPRAWARPANGFGSLVPISRSGPAATPQTARSIVPRFPHLSLAFSGCRSFRLICSTWMFVRTRRPASSGTRSSWRTSPPRASPAPVPARARPARRGSSSAPPAASRPASRSGPPRTAVEDVHELPHLLPLWQGVQHRLPVGPLLRAHPIPPLHEQPAVLEEEGRSARAASPELWVVAPASVCGPGCRAGTALDAGAGRRPGPACADRSGQGRRPAGGGRPATTRPAARGRGPNRRSPPPRAQVPTPGGSSGTASGDPGHGRRPRRRPRRGRSWGRSPTAGGIDPDRGLLWEMQRECTDECRNRINPRVIKRKMSKWKRKRPEHRHLPPLKKTFMEFTVMVR